MRRVFSAMLVLALFSAPSLTAGRSGYELHVDNRSPAASDRNAGTGALPLATVGRGVQLALDANANGAPVTVVIHPGTYRESVSVPQGGTSAAMTFRAADAGEAVISGSDIWTGWKRRGTSPIFTHEWPYAWGRAAIPRHWPALQDIVRRREMVFVGGQLLRQVLAPASLEEGTFFSDEAGRTVYLWPSGGTDPNSVTVEVAVRPTLFAALGRANLTVTGLVFEHAATPLDDSAVTMDQMTNLLVKDTVFRWNNWSGFAVYASTHVTALGNVANHNGGRGMAAWRVKALLYAQNDTSYNNWRGAWGHFLGWAAAGIKVLHIHDGTIRGHRAVFNQAHGLWLDSDIEHVTITDGIWCANHRNGAFIEASQGPVTILRATACLNGERGILTTESSNLTVQNSALYGNGTVQFEVGGEPSRSVKNWETGSVLEVRAQNLTLCGNAFVGERSGQDVLAIPSWGFLLASLRSGRNDWWSPQNAAPFRLVALLDRSLHLDLAGWRRASGQDGDSISADPRFADPATWNFLPLADSRWPRC